MLSRVIGAAVCCFLINTSANATTRILSEGGLGTDDTFYWADNFEPEDLIPSGTLAASRGGSILNMFGENLLFRNLFGVDVIFSDNSAGTTTFIFEQEVSGLGSFLRARDGGRSVVTLTTYDQYLNVLGVHRLPGGLSEAREPKYIGALSGQSNIKTAVFTIKGTTDGLFIDDLRITRSNFVPEPATWALMVAGFGLVGAAIRRRSVAAA